MTTSRLFLLFILFAPLLSDLALRNAKEIDRLMKGESAFNSFSLSELEE